MTEKTKRACSSVERVPEDVGSIPTGSTNDALLRTVSKDELAKIPTLSREEIERALRWGAEEARLAREAFAPPMSTGQRFR